MSFTPAVREVVEFAKRIPGFRDLSEHDQVSLLKAGTFEVRNIRSINKDLQPGSTAAKSDEHEGPVRTCMSVLIGASGAFYIPV